MNQAYDRWVQAGQPWRLAAPIQRLKAVTETHGIAWLGDLGNAGHLTATTPEDHTPYSATAWPVPLPGPVVCAGDAANTHGLGPALLRDMRTGAAPWIKYLNFAGRHYESAATGGGEWDSPDEHVHVSCRSDWCDRDIGTYDPLATTPTNTTMQGDDDMKVLVKRANDPAIWLADGMTRRQISGAAELKDIIYLATAEQSIGPLWNNGQIRIADDLDAFGRAI